MLYDQGVCKPDIVKEVEPLAKVGTWLKESTCTMVSEQVQEYRSASHVHDMVPLNLDCTCASPVSFPTPHNGQESLSDNVTAVIFPMHQPLAAPLASFADGDRRCALAPVLTLPASPIATYTLSSSPHNSPQNIQCIPRTLQVFL